MTSYKNVSGKSGVDAYEIHEGHIDVRFSAEIYRTYRYDHAVTGRGHVEEMKRLATAGIGLNSYINGNVKYQYASKF